VLLSSGFREIIEPILAEHGLAGRVPLLANSIRLDERGGAITWRELPGCDLCGEPCKRHDVAQLREEHAPADGIVVFVGDGLSDRCGAETADRVLARDALARYLDERSLPYEPWTDFDDVVRLLGIEAQPAEVVG
jgi:2-hydroxy-3-keto-5-methylthiopentenyl-1-phosphate phosphatase